MADLVMAGVFQRGAFTPEAALASARVLTAYGAGLFAVVLIRSAVASFQARGDTTTPMVIALAAVAVNVALKFLLFKPFGAAGLALATAVGAWINFLLLAAIAMSRGDMRPDATAWRVAASVAGACGLLALTAIYARAPVGELAARLAPHFVNEAHLALMGALGALVYFAALAGLLLAQGVRPGRLKPMRPAGKRP
jgi:putative peptidoglycan lipid II flippase